MRDSSLSLLIYDLYINIFLTGMFLWPLFRSRLSNPRIRKMATRTLVAAFAALTTSTINIAVLTIMHGQQLGWVCLGSCGTDVTVNALVLFWVTDNISQGGSENTPGTHCPTAAPGAPIASNQSFAGEEGIKPPAPIVQDRVSTVIRRSEPVVFGKPSSRSKGLMSKIVDMLKSKNNEGDDDRRHQMSVQVTITTEQQGDILMNDVKYVPRSESINGSIGTSRMDLEKGEVDEERQREMVILPGHGRKAIRHYFTHFFFLVIDRAIILIHTRLWRQYPLDLPRNMATNHIPVPATQAALSLLSLSSGMSSTPPPSQPPPTSAPTLGRFVHTPRSTASVVRPSSVAPSPTSTPSAGRRRPSSTTLSKRRTSDATRGDSVAPGSSTDSPTVEANGGKSKKGTIFKSIAIQIAWSNIDGNIPPIGGRRAAAILSHISPAKNGMGTSLPEDRSLWPAYLSGGLLPMPTGASAPTAPLVPSRTAYREREASVTTSVVEDDEDMGESSDDREDSGYGSSSAALAVPGRPQPRPHQTYGVATSIGGHEYTLSSSHAGCDAGAHIGSMAYQFSIGRSMSASSFGLSSLRGRDDEDEDETEGTTDDHNHTHTNGNGRKWDEDESMAMDMDL
ncbi:unnamed protein product [Rhizoctonia solani]|uniref:Uncharacterized protein n=1 Tax=Rhizoctonia solani TaxID=456999 RepID=A0A8H3C8F8_9AGAM|nr:unnamed protein product [Rhizoctonia solani]